MKRKLVISACIALLTLSSFGYYVFSHASYPEKAIVGEWKEVSWVYDRNNVGEKVKQVIETEERIDIANHLVIHEFENWTFRKDYSIKLHERTGKEHQAKWRLKDRGRILTLLNDNGTSEVYSVESLKDNELILHFDTDVHARGIVKITLKKIN
jgi:aldehyde:ferredoxin oxidoreductase